MFLEILTIGHDIDLFIGPFRSKLARRYFRAFWERQLQVEFSFHKFLPEGRSAIHPRDFRDSKELKTLPRKKNKRL